MVKNLLFYVSIYLTIKCTIVTELYFRVIVIKEPGNCVAQ